MDKAIERLFRFIEMIGITALIKAVIAPSYPIGSNITVGVLTGAASLYLVLPAYDYCLSAVTDGAKSVKNVVIGSLVTAALFSIVQFIWIQPLVLRVSDLIKETIAAPAADPPAKPAPTLAPPKAVERATKP